MAVRPAALVLIFAVAFTGTGELAERLLPWPAEHDLRAKYEHLRAHRDDYDVVVFGSSRTYRAVVPAALEQRLALHGTTARVFNFSLPGGGAFEMNHLLREVLALNPAELDLVVMELQSWTLAGRDANALSPRNVHWHTTALTLDALRHLAGAGRDRTARMELARSHVQAWIWKQTLFGRGRDLVAALGAPDPPPLTEDGYAALEDSPDHRHRRETFLEDTRGFHRRLRSLENPPERTRQVDDLWLRTWREQASLAEARGVGLVYLVPPGTVGPDGVLAIAESHRLTHLLLFNRPDEYPELHRPGAYFDQNHLSRASAEHFSRLLADLLLPLLRDRQGRGPGD